MSDAYFVEFYSETGVGIAPGLPNIPGSFLFTAVFLGQNAILLL